ncbi:MAG: YdcF family protein [Chlorobaculum sp.]|jgi:vancomycin permeability regulator SanA|nr:YdcF family protein [Chlorobaculum sp.]
MSAEAEVIVVLGASVLPDGTPSPTLERRTFYGIDLYQRHEASCLLFSGGVGRSGFSEALVMRQIALERGVPEAHIFIDDLSTDTLESAVNCSMIIKENGWSKVIIVTDSYHLLRSLFAFRQMGVDVEGRSPTTGRGMTSRGRWIFYHVREIIALPWYLVRLSFQKYLKQKSLR